MSQTELAEHLGYLADERKVAAYRAALEEVVRPGDRVLDLGAGSGLLGYLACDAGAGTVVAVDHGDIISLARRIAADNGYADRIRHVQARSTELEADEPFDVAVCDQIGGLVHDAGVLSCFADARRRLLAPDARLVPAAFRTFLAPVTFDVGRRNVDFWSSSPSGFDVRAAREHAANTEWRYNVGPDHVARLAEPAELAAFDSDDEDAFRGRTSYDVGHAGRLDGLLGWFEATMSPSVTLTNDPWSPDRFDRWCNFYPLDEAVQVVQGDEVAVEIDVRPRLGLVTWSVDVRAGERSARSRQSTFRSSFLSARTIDGAGTPVPDGADLDHARAVLDLVDGRRSTDDIAAALTHLVGDGFASRNHLDRFVRDLTDLLRR